MSTQTWRSFPIRKNTDVAEQSHELEQDYKTFLRLQKKLATKVTREVSNGEFTKNLDLQW